MGPTLRAAFESEMSAAADARRGGELDRAFAHLERAHILGQQYIASHVRSHLAMLHVGWLRRDAKEIVGQLVRVPAAVLASGFGVPPGGNTGGAHVGFFETMPIPDDLQALLDAD